MLRPQDCATDQRDRVGYLMVLPYLLHIAVFLGYPLAFAFVLIFHRWNIYTPMKWVGLGNIKLFLAAICGAVTFTILLVSANTVAMAVRERTREMAILRTLGYTPAEILQLVLGESIVISLLGGLAGLGFGWLLGRALQASPANFGFTGIKWQAAIFVMAMAAFIGCLAALVPALIAARKNVVESIRFTG